MVDQMRGRRGSAGRSACGCGQGSGLISYGSIHTVRAQCSDTNAVGIQTLLLPIHKQPPPISHHPIYNQPFEIFLSIPQGMDINFRHTSTSSFHLLATFGGDPSAPVCWQRGAYKWGVYGTGRARGRRLRAARRHSADVGVPSPCLIQGLAGEPRHTPREKGNRIGGLADGFRVSPLRFRTLPLNNGGKSLCVGLQVVHIRWHSPSV